MYTVGTATGTLLEWPCTLHAIPDLSDEVFLSTNFAIHQQPDLKGHGNEADFLGFLQK
jgi:hypothetical protein